MEQDFTTDQTARQKLKKLLTTTRKKSDFLRVQCVWLRLELNLKADDIATITQLKPGTVRKIWSAFLRDGETALFEKDRGGRRHCHLSKEEETLFLEPYLKKSTQGQSLNVSEIKEAYEVHIGKEVPKSTIYRMLARNGWRKKTGREKTTEAKSKAQKTDMHDYWIEGCSQLLHPEKTGNISQQWLNQTLNSMVKSKATQKK